MTSSAAATRHVSDPKGGSAVHTLDPAAIPQLPTELDELDPLEALQLVAEIRSWALQAFDEQMLRARIRRCSWRAIAAASGVNASTTRRWALMGVPESPRRRR